MSNYKSKMIEHAKSEGEQSRVNAQKNKQPFRTLEGVIRKALINNPYNLCTGGDGKRLKAAWHNAFRAKDKLLTQ